MQTNQQQNPNLLVDGPVSTEFPIVVVVVVVLKDSSAYISCTTCSMKKSRIWRGNKDDIIKEPDLLMWKQKQKRWEAHKKNERTHSSYAVITRFVVVKQKHNLRKKEKFARSCCPYAYVYFAVNPCEGSIRRMSVFFLLMRLCLFLHCAFMPSENKPYWNKTSCFTGTGY